MTNDCNEKDLYESQQWCPGQKVLPGIRGQVFFIPKRSIVSWPKLPNIDDLKTGDSFAELAKYKGNFILAADKKWRKMDVVMNESPINCDPQGEKPSKTFLNKGVFKMSSTGEGTTAFARMANDDDFVYIFLHKEGKARVLGNEMFDTETKPKQEIGDAPTSKTGTTLEVEVTDICMAPYYPGKIETEDGDIDGSNGNAWDEGIEPVITTEALPAGVQGNPYSATVVATGDAPVELKVVEGSLPSGVVMSSAGVLTGTPTAEITATFIVEAKNVYGSAYKQFSIVIAAVGG